MIYPYLFTVKESYWVLTGDHIVDGYPMGRSDKHWTLPNCPTIALLIRIREGIVTW